MASFPELGFVPGAEPAWGTFGPGYCGPPSQSDKFPKDSRRKDFFLYQKKHDYGMYVVKCKNLPEF